jgi:hypothetical protein
MKSVNSENIRRNVFRIISVRIKSTKNKDIADVLGWTEATVSQKIMPKPKTRRTRLSLDNITDISNKLNVYPAIFFWNLEDMDDDELEDWVNRATWFMNQTTEDRRTILMLGINTFNVTSKTMKNPLLHLVGQK